MPRNRDSLINRLREQALKLSLVPSDTAPTTVQRATAAAVLNNHPRPGFEKGDRLAAQSIVKRLLAEAQQQNPGHPAYGHFTLRLGEPLADIADKNMADFVGLGLLQILQYDTTRLLGWPSRERETLEEGIRRAALATMRRDVRLGYTNIVLMSIYLMLGAGRLLKDKRLRAAGERKLGKYLRFHGTTGSFEEYNSPTYAGVCLGALVPMADLEKDGPLAEKTSGLLKAFLRHLSLHYHHPLRELGGPHSRAYSDTLGERSTLNSFLCSAGLCEPEDVGGIAYAAAMPGLILPQTLREALAAEFKEPLDNRELVEWIGRDTTLPAPSGPPHRFRMITTHRDNLFVLGSVNEMDVWHQRRNLVAYWLNEDGDVTGIKLEVIVESRALEEGFEYGVWPLQMGLECLSVQEGPRVLGCITRADVAPAGEGDELQAPSAYMAFGFEDCLVPKDPSAWLLGTHWRQPIEKGEEKVPVERLEIALTLLGGGNWRKRGEDAFVFRTGQVTAAIRTGIDGAVLEGNRLILSMLEDFEWNWLGRPNMCVPFAMTLSIDNGNVPPPVERAESGTAFSIQSGDLRLVRKRTDSPERIEERTWFGYVGGKEILPEI